MTKEELLQKGIDPEVADEIIAAFEETTDGNSLSALQKALDDDGMDSLFKAKGGKEGEKEEEEEEEEDYNAEYMKKHMKRYMKENKSACAKAAKESGLFEEKLEKAMETFDTSADGAIVEMADLLPILEHQKEFNSAMQKAVEFISGQVLLIASQNEKSFDLMQKAARVQVEQANSLGEFLSVPQGRKGVIASMQKATPAIAAVTPEGNKLIYQTLMKAVQGGDKMAGQIISVFESNGHDASKLNEVSRKYINDLIQKGAN